MSGTIALRFPPLLADEHDTASNGMNQGIEDEIEENVRVLDRNFAIVVVHWLHHTPEWRRN